jgi:hypothetical protein
MAKGTEFTAEHAETAEGTEEITIENTEITENETRKPLIVTSRVPHCGLCVLCGEFRSLTRKLRP